MSTKVYGDLTESGKLRVTFDFDPAVIAAVKMIPGRKWVPADKGGPAWDFPLDVQIGRRLKEKFGRDFIVRKELKQWAEVEVAAARHLANLSAGTSADLSVLPDVLPDLWRAVHVGPKGRGLDINVLEDMINENPEGSYQTADVAYLAAADNPLNGNQPGLGKTIETIASIFESGADDGPHLILAPLSSLESVWENELRRWQPHPVWRAQGGAYDKSWIINDFLGTEGPGWLVCNHHMAQLVTPRGGRGEEAKARPRFPELYELEWNTVILDEVHKAGFRDLDSNMYQGIFQLQAQKKMALSGTPVGGKPINLWYILHWLHPHKFTSKWQWANMWLEVIDNGYGKNIGRIRDGLEEEFYRVHAPYFLRRTKAECLPWLPPKTHIVVDVEMDEEQAKQYEEFALAAEVRIEDESLTAFGILAEYTRLKQFAISKNTIKYYYDTGPDSTGERKFKPIPTEKSCKLDALVEILDEHGIIPESKSDVVDVEHQVVVFSQFSTVVDMIAGYLAKQNVNVEKLTGATSPNERTRLQERFQNKEIAVLCMTTTAGGVAITLDAADTCVFIDETWDPGDQEQAEDRIHRASRIHNVTVYTLRTKKTIEEYISRVLTGKENVNKMILDLRAAGLRATEKS